MAGLGLSLDARNNLPQAALSLTLERGLHIDDSSHTQVKYSPDAPPVKEMDFTALAEQEGCAGAFGGEIVMVRYEGDYLLMSRWVTVV